MGWGRQTISGAPRRTRTTPIKTAQRSGGGESELNRLIRQAERGGLTAAQERRLTELYSSRAAGAPVASRDAPVNQRGRSLGPRRWATRSRGSDGARRDPGVWVSDPNEPRDPQRWRVRSRGSERAAGGGGRPWGASTVGFPTGVPSAEAAMPAEAAPPDDGMAQLAALFASMPGIDKNSYVGPYDQAMAQARSVHGEAVPAIQAIFGQLGGRLGGLQGDCNQQADAAQGAAKAEDATQLDALKAAAMSELTKLRAQGVDVGHLLGTTAAAGGEQVGNLASNQALGQGALDRAQQLQQMSMNERQADVPAMEASGLSTAQNNLNALLSQLGFGRAGAERDYNTDVAAREAEKQRVTQDFISARQQAEAEAQERAFRESERAQDRSWQQQDRAEERAWKAQERRWTVEDREKAAREKVQKERKEAQKAADPRQTFINRTLPRLSTRAQKVMSSVIEDLDPAYKGIEGYNKAKKMLEDADEEAMAKVVGFRVDKAKVAEYLRRYFGVS
jgi:hypothetical protein